jgi:hypothetical protein
VVFDGLVYGGHEMDGLSKGGDHLLVVVEVVEGKGAAFAVFELLFADLIAADVELPGFGGDAPEVLGGVDPDAGGPVLVPCPQAPLGRGKV